MRSEHPPLAPSEGRRALFDAIDDGFCVFQVLYDDDGEPVDYRFLDVNPAFANHTGLHDAAGRTIREFQPDMESHWFTIYGRIARTRQPERFVEHSGELGDRWFEVYAFPVDEPEHHRVAAIFRDITERRRAEDRLAELHEELEDRVERRTRQVRRLSESMTMAEQRERERLSRLLHDDLQQLLYGIQMRMTLVQDRADVDDLDGVRRATSRALDHLDDAIRRTRELTVDLSPPFLRDEGLSDALEWLRSQMRDLHGLHVAITADRDVDVTPTARRIVVFQIVRELLFNVAKHAGVDRAEVHVDEHDGTVRVTVVDAGRGIDPTVVELDQDGRHGLGLASARERLRLLGGALEVGVPEVGQGSRVVVVVPAAPVSSDAAR
ncbi:ATP-binding protein [Salsipaludibacter albus]|uniref:PAS domain-containing sensor histidine kinase n=1 Tax=Salsipaludibacter albus TaxID=2849650 RepID=UPI001EE3B587|nr:ATP-binding protein [Salsipaludibacter albus]MBY5163260.1 PAS domain-containing protein [Salsipaludibacter albus]